MPTLRFLEYLVAVNQSGSFKRAALELHVSQPALSKGIKALEAEFGASLLDRGSHPVGVTPCGQVALDRAREIIDHADRIALEINAVKGLVTGSVRIGAGPIASASIVGPSVARLATAHPALEIELRLGNWRNLTQALRRQEIDIFVGDLTEANAEEFDRYEFPREEMLWFGRAGHPLTGRGILQPQDLFAFPVAGPTPPKWAEAWMKRAMPGHDTRKTPMTVRCDDYLLTREIVRHSDCISAAPRRLLRTDLEAGTMAVLPVDFPPMKSAVGIVTLAGKTLAPAAGALTCLLKDAGLSLFAEDAMATGNTSMTAPAPR